MSICYRSCVYTILCAIALAGTAQSICFGNTSGGCGFWNPGFVDVYFPLAWVSKPSLKDACKSLTVRDFNKAARAFTVELQNDPNDEAAYLGLLEATNNLTEVESDHLASVAKVAPSAANDFRSGAYALLIVNKCYSNGPPDESGRELVPKELPIAYNGLSADFKLTHSILAGELLVQVNQYGATATDSRTVLETIVKGLSGTKIYEGYEAAKANGFHGQLPDVPQLSKDNNSILRRMVLDLWMFYGAVPGVFKNGAWSPAPETPLQNAAMKYLSAWAKKIADANPSTRSD